RTTTSSVRAARDTMVRSGSSQTVGSASFTAACTLERSTTKRPRGRITSPKRKPTLPELTGSVGGVSPLLVKVPSRVFETRGFHKQRTLARGGGPYGWTVCRDRFSSSTVGDCAAELQR